MAIDTKLEDTQLVTIIIANGDSEGFTVISTGLKDQDGDDVEPASVIPELRAAMGSGDARRGVGLQINRKSDGLPYDHLETNQIQITAMTATDNTSGSDWTILARITSVYWHSMQGTDQIG